MEIHYKATVWVAIKFDDDINKEEIINRLESGELPLDIGADFNVEYENIVETETPMSLKENDGQATIEVMDDNPVWDVVWDNSYESETKRLRNILKKNKLT